MFIHLLTTVAAATLALAVGTAGPPPTSLPAPVDVGRPAGIEAAPTPATADGRVAATNASASELSNPPAFPDLAPDDAYHHLAMEFLDPQRDDVERIALAQQIGQLDGLNAWMMYSALLDVMRSQADADEQPLVDLSIDLINAVAFQVGPDHVLELSDEALHEAVLAALARDADLAARYAAGFGGEIQAPITEPPVVPATSCPVDTGYRTRLGMGSRCLLSNCQHAASIGRVATSTNEVCDYKLAYSRRLGTRVFGTTGGYYPLGKSKCVVWGAGRNGLDGRNIGIGGSALVAGFNTCVACACISDTCLKAIWME